MINRRARPEAYRSKRDYVAADFASRTMRWTGIIVVLFVVFHLLDLTWGPVNPDFVSGDPYHNVVASFERVPVSIIYVIANLALGVHLYHGAWSLFQSMGWTRPWRRQFATVFAGLIVLGNVSFPLAVMFGVVN
jgi:succinate dehydrogenase / fumarate reductase cytochrome b subunit